MILLKNHRIILFSKKIKFINRLTNLGHEQYEYQPPIKQRKQTSYTQQNPLPEEKDDEEGNELKFTLPSLCSMNHEQQLVTLNTIRIDRISHIPANSYITIEYTTLSRDQLKVYGMSLNTSSA